jgi:hypothetical protein
MHLGHATTASVARQYLQRSSSGEQTAPQTGQARTAPSGAGFGMEKVMPQRHRACRPGVRPLAS